jgi:hypothetical protein
LKYMQPVLVVVLLAVAVTVNYLTMSAPRAERDRPVSAEAVAPLAIDPPEQVAPVEPLGPPDAPVTMTVFYETGNPCHDFLGPQARALAARYAPRVRLEVAPWRAEGTDERAERLTVDCRVAVTVSGPPPFEESERPAIISFAGPTEVGAWSWDEVAAAIEARLIAAGVDPEPVEPSDHAVETAPPTDQ